jgi:hypothetical protein
MSEPVSKPKCIQVARPSARWAISRVGLLSLATLAGALAFAACGDDSPAPADEPDGSAGESGGTGGNSEGGPGGAGGGGTSGGAGGAKQVDRTPPTFNGISGIEAVGEGSARVSWAPATDNVTAPGAMGYRVYRAATKGGQDFTRKRRCDTFLPDASTVTQAEAPCFVTAPSGATSAVVRDALPSQDFYYVARAVDGAGNEDSNTNEASFQTKDSSSPVFGGVDSVTALTATSIEVTWGPAFDTTAPDPTLTYSVYLTQDAVPDPKKDDPVYVSKPGEHSTIITKLDPLTTYHVIVQATDPSGNTEGNTYSLGVTTPEGIGPTFNGLRQASADGNTVRLFWLPASDNVTHPENILYDVYSSLTQHREDFSKKPRATSAPGAASITLQEVNAATRYFYVVRARDFAGNTDTNNVEKSAQTGPLPDITPPDFKGAQSVQPAGPTSLTVAWNAAADETSGKDDFTYLIYASTTTPVPLDKPALTVRGALSGTLIGLTPATTYNVIVIAKDAAGNASKAAATVSKATAAAIPGDTTAPTMTTPTVDQVVSPPSQLNVAWTAGADAPNTAGDIRYHVCVSTKQSDCQGAAFAAHVAATTAYGTLTARLSFLQPRTSYFVYVRAEDRAGNLESADHFAPRTTATAWTQNVKPILFNRCISCHDFDNAANLVGVGSTYLQSPTEKPSCTVLEKPEDGFCRLKIVDQVVTSGQPTIGRPEFSYLYRRINPLGLTTPPFSAAVPNQYSGAREPRDTIEKLSVEEDRILLDWITQGALAN